MARGARLGGAQFAVFRKLISDMRTPARLGKNPLISSICGATGTATGATFIETLRISLYRLSNRHRSIVQRYDIAGEPVAELCTSLGLSRRQFFRDHRAALEQLAALMLPRESNEPVSGPAPTVRARERTALQTPARAIAGGLRNAGAFGEALRVLESASDARASAETQLDIVLDIASLCVECGDTEGAKNALKRARLAASPGLLDSPRQAARIAFVEGQLMTLHVERRQKFETARDLLVRSIEKLDERAECGHLLAETLYALSLSDDHRGRWAEARRVALEARKVAEQFALTQTPLGFLIAANCAVRDARQFGNVDAALDGLRSCLAGALLNGWVHVIGDVAVQFINLNLMRSRYDQALAWRRWIGAVEPARLTARTRNFLVVDTAHALTMLGRPDRAQGVLKAGDDEGLAFHGARAFWRAEALQVRGDANGARALAERALDGAAEAASEKGRARSKRVLARCEHALGNARSARKAMDECLELSAQFVSPYDLLLSLSAARGIAPATSGDEVELTRLLRGSAPDAEFGPPDVRYETAR